MGNRVAFPLLSLGSFGGVRKIIELANGLVDYGYDVTLLYPEGRGYTPFRIRPEVKRITVAGRNRLIALLRYSFMIKKYDVVVLNFWPTAYLFPFARKSLYFIQDLEYRFHSNPILRTLSRLTYFFPVIKFTYNPALAEAAGVKYIIPAAVDRRTFYPDPDPSLRSGGRYVIMYMPRKEKRKGADIFKRAVEILKGCCDFEVWLVGGPKDLLTDLPVPVRRFHPRNDDELRVLYSSADLFVLSSLSEGLGFPVLEALSCGTPVVATNVDGSMAWPSDGVKIVSISAESLAEGIKDMIENLKFWKGRAARASVPDIESAAAALALLIATV